MEPIYIDPTLTFVLRKSADSDLGLVVGLPGATSIGGSTVCAAGVKWNLDQTSPVCSDSEADGSFRFVLTEVEVGDEVSLWANLEGHEKSYFGVNNIIEVVQIWARLFPEEVTDMVRTPLGLFIAAKDGLYWIYAEDLAKPKDLVKPKKFTMGDGLPGNHITRLAVDPSGYIWIGTLNKGISRAQIIDKKRIMFRNITAAHGLPSEKIRALHASQDGSVWVGTKNGELIQLRSFASASVDGGEVSVKPGVKSYGQVSAYPITCLEEDPSGAIWFGTLGGGVVRMTFIGGTPTFTPYVNLPNQNVHSLLIDEQGYVWAGTVNYVSRTLYNGVAGFKKEHFVIHQAENGGSSAVLNLTPHPEGGILVGHQSGLSWIMNVRLVFQYSWDSPGFTTPDGQYIVGIMCESGGLSDEGEYTDNSNCNRDVILRNGNISSLIVDGDKLWMGTYGAWKVSGLHSYAFPLMPPYDITVSSYSFSSQGLPSNRIQALAMNEGHGVWIGTDLSLTYLDDFTGEGRFQHFVMGPLYFSKNIKSLASDGIGGVWLTLGNQIGHVIPTVDSGFRYEDPYKFASFPSDQLTSIASDGGEGAFVGTRDIGLIHIWPDRGRWPYSVLDIPIDSHILSIAEDHVGGIWTVTGSSTDSLSYQLTHIAYVNGTLQIVAQMDVPYLDGPAKGLAVSEDGRVWIGRGSEDGSEGESEGVFLYFIVEGQLVLDQIFTTDDGLPTNTILSVAINPLGGTFVGTDNGLAFLLPPPRVVNATPDETPPLDDQLFQP